MVSARSLPKNNPHIGPIFAVSAWCSAALVVRTRRPATVKASICCRFKSIEIAAPLIEVRPHRAAMTPTLSAIDVDHNPAPQLPGEQFRRRIEGFAQADLMTD